MIHPQANAHYRELAREVSLERATQDQIERLPSLLLAALDCAYSAAEKNSRLRGRVAELEQTVTWQGIAITELEEDRQLLLTIIEEAACMPPLFTYCRRPAIAVP